MFKYQMNHPTYFKDMSGNSTMLAASLVALMQLGSSIATEIVSLFLIIEAETEKDCLMNFLAIEIISQIDEIYYSTIRNEALKEAIGQNSPEITNTTKKLRLLGRTPG